MQAIILAGGKGTRLRPYTVSLPKPLVPIGDRPIIEIVLNQLSESGFDDIIISTGYLAELIIAYCGGGKKWNLRVRYVHEDKPLSTAGALRLVDGLDDHFLLVNGDILTNLNFREFFDKHVAASCLATIATTTRESLVDLGVLEMTEEGMLKRYIEKPVYRFNVSMGIYVLSRDIVQYIQEGEVIGMPDLLLRACADDKKVFCYNTECKWLDIGRPDDYERAQQEFFA